MPTNYPNGLDSFTNPVPGDIVKSAPIGNAFDAIEAVEGFVGVTDNEPGTLVDRIAALENAGGGAGVADDLVVPLSASSFASWSRKFPTVTTALTAGNGMVLVSFISPMSITAAAIKIYITSGGGSPTTSQLGLYSVNSSGDGTLIGSTSSTSDFTQTGLRSFAITSPVAITAGSRYAVGIVVSNSTGPTLLGIGNGANSSANLALLNPWGYALRGSVTSAPSSFTYANLTAAGPGYPVFYFEITA